MASIELLVEAATTGHGESWDQILRVSDEVKKSPQNYKKFFSAIWRRLKDQDPRVVLEAITVLNSCVKNGDKNFLVEIASRDFETKFTALLNQSKIQPEVRHQLLGTLRGWAEGEFSNDPQLSLIPMLFAKLRQEGHFVTETHKNEKSSLSRETAIADQELAQAIELSLQEEKKKNQSVPNNNSNTSSLYPTALLGRSQPEGRKVRALYDFVDAEEGELSFKAGEIITITEEADPCWWKGYNERGEGVLPANFVTSDLSVEVDKPKSETKRTIQFDDRVRVQDFVKEEVVIDETKMDLLLHYLHEADPTDPSRDPPEMRDLAEQWNRRVASITQFMFIDEVNAMGPLIDTELERVDGKHAQLTQLCLDLQNALNMYHMLMRDPSQPGSSDVVKPMSNAYPMHAPTMNGPGHPSGMIPNPYGPHPPHSNAINGPPQPPASFLPDPTLRHGAPMFGIPGGAPPGAYPMAPMTTIPGTSAPLSHQHPSYHDKPPLL